MLTEQMTNENGHDEHSATDEQREGDDQSGNFRIQANSREGLSPRRPNRSTFPCVPTRENAQPTFLVDAPG